MQRSLCLLKNVWAWASKDNCTCLIPFASWKFYYFVLPNQNLLDWITGSQYFLRSFRIIKSWYNLSSQSSWDPFYSLKICMLDNHDSVLNKKLLWIIIDKLPVDIYIRFISYYFLYFFFHFHFLCLGNLSNFLQWLNTNSGTINLNFVIIHRGICC